MIFSFFLCTAAWSSPGNYKHRSIEQKDNTSLNKLILFFVHITRVWSIFNDNNQHETKRYSTSTRSYWVQGHEILDHRSTIGHDNSIVFDGESDRILAKICTILLATQQQSSMWSNLTWLSIIAQPWNVIKKLFFDVVTRSFIVSVFTCRYARCCLFVDEENCDVFEKFTVIWSQTNFVARF